MKNIFKGNKRSVILWAFSLTGAYVINIFNSYKLGREDESYKLKKEERRKLFNILREETKSYDRVDSRWIDDLMPRMYTANFNTNIIDDYTNSVTMSRELFAKYYDLATVAISDIDLGGFCNCIAYMRIYRCALSDELDLLEVKVRMKEGA